MKSDKQTKEKIQGPMMLAAQDLVSRGLRVFPVLAGKKHPAVNSFPSEATKKPAKFGQHWNRDTPANIGVSTGNGLVVVDIDTKNGKQGDQAWKNLCDEIGFNPDTFTVRTPNGTHYYFRGEGKNTVSKLGPGIDTRGNRGYVVGPSSVVNGNEYAVINDKEIASFPPALAERLQSTHREAPQDVPETADNPKAIRAATKFLQEDAPLAVEGDGGDQTTLSVAARLKDFGLTRGTALALLLEHWNDRCSGPWSESELEVKVDNAYQYCRANQPGEDDPELMFGDLDLPVNDNRPGAQPKKLLPFMDLAALDGRIIPPREWAVQDRIPLRQPTLLSGHGAAGKSILALHLEAATVLNRDWLGFRPRPGPAIYFGAEDDEDELQRRLAGINEHYGSSFRDLAEGGLYSLSYAGKDALLGVPDKKNIIRRTTLFDRLRDAARDIRPSLITIDAAADVFAGDENNRSQTRQFMGMLRNLAIEANAAVILVVHPSIQGNNSGSGLSGSTAWYNSARAQVHLGSPGSDKKDEPDYSDLRELSFKKSNYSRFGDDPMVLRWHPAGLFLPEQAGDTLEKKENERKVDERFTSLLRRFNEGNRHVGMRPGTSYAPALFAKDAEAKEAKIGRKAFEAAMFRLWTKKQIRIEEYGPPSRKSQRLVEDNQEKA